MDTMDTTYIRGCMDTGYLRRPLKIRGHVSSRVIIQNTVSDCTKPCKYDNRLTDFAIVKIPTASFDRTSYVDTCVDGWMDGWNEYIEKGTTCQIKHLSMIRLCRFFWLHDISNKINYNHLILSWASNVASSITLHHGLFKNKRILPKGPQVVVVFSCQGPVCPWVLACESPSCNNDQSLMENWALWLAGIASKIDVRWGVDWFDGWRWIGVGYEIYEIDMN